MVRPRFQFLLNQMSLIRQNDLNSFEKTTALSPLNQLTIENVEPKANQGTWCNWVNQALTRIRQGELTKLVLANETVFRIHGELNGKDFLAASQAKNSGCYHFLWADNAQNCFVGSTPERLFARDERQLFTEALAGTAPVSDNPSENDERANWLLNDEKNLNENWLVVEDISQNISHLVEQITVDDVALKSLRKVQHLIRKNASKIDRTLYGCRFTEGDSSNGSGIRFTTATSKESFG